MTVTRPVAPRGRVRAAACVALALALLVLVPVSPASAHTELVASTPVRGASVAMSLDRVVLTFSEDLVAGASAVVVTGAAGADVTVARSGVAGAVIEVGVSLDAAGRHDVTYRVVAQDGHVVTGSYWFTAVEGAPPIADETAVSRVDARDGPAPAGSSAGDTPSGAPGAAATAAAPGTNVSGTPVVAVVLGLVGVAALLLLARRTRRRPRGPESG